MTRVSNMGPLQEGVINTVNFFMNVTAMVSTEFGVPNS